MPTAIAAADNPSRRLGGPLIGSIGGPGSCPGQTARAQIYPRTGPHASQPLNGRPDAGFHPESPQNREPRMIIGIVSDTHGHVEYTRPAVRMLESLEVELVIHCGDIGSPEIVELFAPWPAHFVFGNVDDRPERLRRAIAAAGKTCHERFGSARTRRAANRLPARRRCPPAGRYDRRRPVRRRLLRPYAPRRVAPRGQDAGAQPRRAISGRAAYTGDFATPRAGSDARTGLSKISPWIDSLAATAASGGPQARKLGRPRP